MQRGRRLTVAVLRGHAAPCSERSNDHIVPRLLLSSYILQSLHTCPSLPDLGRVRRNRLVEPVHQLGLAESSHSFDPDRERVGDTSTEGDGVQSRCGASWEKVELLERQDGEDVGLGEGVRRLRGGMGPTEDERVDKGETCRRESRGEGVEMVVRQFRVSGEML